MIPIEREVWNYLKTKYDHWDKENFIPPAVVRHGIKILLKKIEQKIDDHKKYMGWEIKKIIRGK